ncbi:MAG: hypothetical protein ABN488_17855 [Methylobacteriaceae bacterium]
MRRARDWFFRDRTTGAITIAQAPNAPLLVFAACALTEWLVAPEGRAGILLRGLGALALAYWALDEIIRGVNPWRRCLGAIVLAGLAWNFAQALT